MNWVIPVIDYIGNVLEYVAENPCELLNEGYISFTICEQNDIEKTVAALKKLQGKRLIYKIRYLPSIHPSRKSYDSPFCHECHCEILYWKP